VVEDEVSTFTKVVGGDNSESEFSLLVFGDELGVAHLYDVVFVDRYAFRYFNPYSSCG
jgi:hypothetical protein